MKVYFTGAGAGDLEYLTVKAHRLLSVAKCCIWAGSLINPQILTVLPEGCEVYDSAGMDLPEIIGVMRRCHEAGVDVVRLHTGEPAIFGAINEQMAELDKLGIGYEVIPGISAFQAAAASLQTELTAPEISQSVVITRTSGRTPMPENETLENFAATGATLCLYLSAHKIDEVCASLAQYYGEDCPAAFIYKVSWEDEVKILSTLGALAAEVEQTGLRKTAIIMVGRALAGSAGKKYSKLYDPSFSHDFRDGKN